MGEVLSVPKNLSHYRNFFEKQRKYPKCFGDFDDYFADISCDYMFDQLCFFLVKLAIEGKI